MFWICSYLLSYTYYIYSIDIIRSTWKANRLESPWWSENTGGAQLWQGALNSGLGVLKHPRSGIKLNLSLIGVNRKTKQKHLVQRCEGGRFFFLNLEVWCLSTGINRDENWKESKYCPPRLTDCRHTKYFAGNVELKTIVTMLPNRSEGNIFTTRVSLGQKFKM